jgi:T5SS/PEP-CTERM-associated repeat protein
MGWLLTAWLVFNLPTIVRAQLVADGNTRILDGVITNIVGNLTIGTNGSFTVLVLTNGAAVTNTSTTIIGSAASALSNHVVVTGSGSTLGSTNLLGSVHVGESGSFNELDIFNGGLVATKDAAIGFNAASKSNLVIVADAGSTLTLGPLQIGGSGSGNQLVISNGGVVKCSLSLAAIGSAVSASNNLVLVTGPGSAWSNYNLYVGASGSRNSLIVTNGGTVTGGVDSIGNLNGSAGNTAIVTGSGSSWRNSYLYIGNTGAGPTNRLVIAAGGGVFTTNSCVVGSNCTFNSLLVTGAGSRLTNSQSLIVGYAGRGNELIVSNGAVVSVGATYVEQNSGLQNRIVVTGNGSVLSNSADFYLGQMGSSNLLVVSDGAKLVDNIGYVGYQTLQRFNVAVVSFGTWTNRSDLYIGFNSASSQLLVTNAGRVTANNSIVGADFGGSNSLVVVSDLVEFSPAAPPVPSLWTNRADLYFGMTSAFNQMFVTNGGVVGNNFGYVGFNSSSISNRIFVSGTGSVWQCRALLYLGYFSKGNQLVVSNGGTVTASSLLIGNTTGNASNQVIIAGGNVLVTSCDVNYGTLTMNSGLLNVATLTLNSNRQPRVAFNGGTMQIRNTAATATPFTIGDGTNAAFFEMLLNGTHTVPGGLILRSNAMLKGVGTIVGNATNQGGASISPGSSLAQIFITGNLVCSPGSTNLMDLNANTGASDTIVGMMNVTYSGTLQLSNLAGVLANGNSFTLFSATNYFGAFDSVLPHSPGPNLRWNLDRLTVDGVLQVVAKTPSPPPLISSTTLSAGNLVITGGNGVPYDPCVLWSSTNLAAGVWTSWVTNYFDASGNVIFSNLILPGEPARFFRLQVE